MSGEIPKDQNIISRLFRIRGAEDFEKTALDVFRFQYLHNPLYKEFADLMNYDVDAVRNITQIPFLPISFFKTNKVGITLFEPEVVFESSGTTGSIPSRHFVKDAQLYKQSFKQAFELFYGPVTDYCILALLPSYLERSHSSLVYMVKHLMELSDHPSNGFYLYELDRLHSALAEQEQKGQKTLLIGVTYALLDFAAAYRLPLNHTIVMETGGMKGRKEEVVRSEVHRELKEAFGAGAIHSEYGMTELLSQAYAKGDGVFETPPWMKVLIREEDDPKGVYAALSKPLTGAINIIDLANVYSCSFLATDDLGKLHPEGRFEVLGRIDNSDVRGCSLLTV